MGRAFRVRIFSRPVIFASCSFKSGTVSHPFSGGRMCTFSLFCEGDIVHFYLLLEMTEKACVNIGFGDEVILYLRILMFPGGLMGRSGG